MRRLDSNTLLSISILIFSGALIFFGLRFQQRMPKPPSYLPPSPPGLSNFKLPLPPSPPEIKWVGNSFEGSTGCSVDFGSEKILLMGHSGYTDVQPRLVIVNIETGEWNIKNNLSWFCPIKFVGSKLYGKNYLNDPHRLVVATIRDGIITPRSLDVPAGGITSPDNNYIAFSTSVLYGEHGDLRYCRLSDGETTHAIRILDLHSEKIITVREDSTHALRLSGWSRDGKYIGYEKIDYLAGSKIECNFYEAHLNEESIDVSVLLPKATE